MEQDPSRRMPAPLTHSHHYAITHPEEIGGGTTAYPVHDIEQKEATNWSEELPWEVVRKAEL